MSEATYAPRTGEATGTPQAYMVTIPLIVAKGRRSREALRELHRSFVESTLPTSMGLAVLDPESGKLIAGSLPQLKERYRDIDVKLIYVAVPRYWFMEEIASYLSENYHKMITTPNGKILAQKLLEIYMVLNGLPREKARELANLVNMIASGRARGEKFKAVLRRLVMGLAGI